jgi:hypothetical protein
MTAKISREEVKDIVRCIEASVVGYYGKEQNSMRIRRGEGIDFNYLLRVVRVSWDCQPVFWASQQSTAPEQTALAAGTFSVFDDGLSSTLCLNQAS